MSFVFDVMAICSPRFSEQSTRWDEIFVWGITRPWIMGATARRKQVEQMMCFIASPDLFQVFILNSMVVSPHCASRQSRPSGSAVG